MPDYKAMYYKLCHAQAKVDYLLEEARAVIGAAQQDAERMYLESKDPLALPDGDAAPLGKQHTNNE